MSSDADRNAAPRLPAHDTWERDDASAWWLEHLCGDHLTLADRMMLTSTGTAVGSWELQDAADLANRNDPQLHTFDRHGGRIDEITFDASWHTVSRAMRDTGVCALPWIHPECGYLLRTAALEQLSRLDIGAMCPVSMTTAAIPVLRMVDPDSEALRDLMEPGPDHAMAGMALTEPQGGSDLAGISVTATAQPDGTSLLNGHKWFCSYPVAEWWLLLAREPEGISCFLAPGWNADGSRNGFELQRLKDKLGTRSLPSAEVELRDMRATRLGPAGRGVRTIIDMVVHTRMDCTIGGTGVMARAISEAVHHAQHRRAFGSRLIDKPLMRATLTDMALEREGALAISYEVARCFQEDDPLQRLVPAIAKYWVTRRSVAVAVEAVEALGGSGYTEEFVLARLMRDAQVNSTWEGSGNVIALDLLRACATNPDLPRLLDERIGYLVQGCDAQQAATIRAGTQVWQHAYDADGDPTEANARMIAARLATTLQAALLAHRATVSGMAHHQVISSAFTATRCDVPPEACFGTNAPVLLPAADAALSQWSSVPAPA